MDTNARFLAAAAFIFALISTLIMVFSVTLYGPLAVVYDEGGFQNAVCKYAICPTPTVTP